MSVNNLPVILFLAKQHHTSSEKQSTTQAGTRCKYKGNCEWLPHTRDPGFNKQHRCINIQYTYCNDEKNQSTFHPGIKWCAQRELSRDMRYTRKLIFTGAGK